MKIYLTKLLLLILMEVSQILRLISDFLSENNLHKSAACLIDEANLPVQSDPSKFNDLVDAEDWP